ncbi:MAG: rod shape-determining protein [Parcubacteria group bacterium CG08_land_8_20_14_0_20_48_21]|nr:MAG: rod shape-determining protein [Parcubacteria group bacterium CG2_30_48_51]PIS32556.1 MAG: rod shape-determining protein [Parcubacteria group bacterium CG08_land_8_20_14_0_20_48_21]PIW79354.1 MAG: rod shape-determining protein [Parcubacteria group bacterium CG_4_8_14_3_um_filter_48_16]PIY77985.1 MAG: rod shape-determining protein [Parcubacteria group bacterium CG_4_10_14_0_8_um_filter_48_154]PIZ77810.1 MAG: rod shape-determining protein [bacterium CG_4_10_14_0_2_um_filter_48_144]PJC3989
MVSRFNTFAEKIGVDLGTANVLIYVHGRGIIVNEPSVLAVNTRTNEVLAVGEDAKKMVGKTPAHIVATRPLVDGIISDFEATEKMLKYFFDKVRKGRLAFFSRPYVVIGVPLDITEVEKKAVEDAVFSAGAKEVFLIEEVTAAAIGAGLPIQEATASMIIDIGGGTTDIAVLSLGGVVTSKSLRIAGDEFNRDILTYAREKYNLLLGERMAEEIKIGIGSVIPLEEPISMPMRGRDLSTGLPKEIIVGDVEIRDVLMRSVRGIVEYIREVLEMTPPDLVADIYRKGMVLTGGGALIRGLDELIAQEVKVPVYVADDPLSAVVRGTGIVLQDLALLKEISIPSAQ